MKEMKTLTIGDVQYVIVDGTVGSLDSLNTENKTSVVAAINEVVSKDSSTFVTASSIQNALGYTPVNPANLSLGIHTDGLAYLFVDGIPIGTGIEPSSGGISGYIDSDNIIVINNLSDGTYTVKYEMEDGSTVDVGPLTVGEVTPTAKNYFDTETATLNARLSSSGATSTSAGKVTTDFIPWEDDMTGKTFQIGGLTPVLPTTHSYYARICFYDANKTYVTGYSDTGGDVLSNNGLATVFGNYNGGGFARITVSVTDDIEITATDVAAMTITLE